MSNRPRRSGAVVALSVLIVLLIAATVFTVYLCVDLANIPAETTPAATEQIQLPTPPTTEPAPTQPPPEPEHVVSTATISVQGDLLMHKPIFAEGTAVNHGGVYDFSSVFQYLEPYIASWDYSLANLETTFGGDGFVYQGWPNFNCPDPLADTLADVGYNMLLTANNHCYDTEMTGLTRTLEQLRLRGLATLGTRLSEEEQRYSVVQVGDLRLGLVCYTYTTSMEGSRPRLNGNAPVRQPELVNWFSNTRLDALYGELEQIMSDMRREGAEAFVLFIHWGEEYALDENATQRAIAQRACDLGFNAIVGGHPHVVQPMELLTSSRDPGHTAVCLYSMGNAVSNQRIAEMRLRTGHTEDGALITLTFEKYSDGTVYLAGTEILPTWVNLHYHNGLREYNILPLDSSTRSDWKTLYSLTGDELAAAEASYNRTMALVGGGLENCQNCLAREKLDRADYYWNLAMSPSEEAVPALQPSYPALPEVLPAGWIVADTPDAA